MIPLRPEVQACLAEIGEALDDALLLVDQGGGVQVANRTARELLDLPPGDASLAMGRPWQQELLELLRRLPVEGAATDVHVAGGLPLVIEGYAVELDGGFWGGILIVRSATARRRELPPGRASEFAHEVKSGLHSLLLNVYMLRKWAASQPYVETQTLAKFDLVSNEIHRLNGVAEEFLPDAHARGRRDVVRPAQLLAEAVARVSATAREAGIELRSRVPGDLPSLPGDARLLRDAFQALLEHRLEALAPGGELEVQAGVGGKQLFVMITDTGSATGEAGDALRGGRGLGLTEWVVRGHGGSFETFSAGGLGSTVVVKLPLLAAWSALGDSDLGLMREA